jgi:hypothetical protein
VQQVGEQARAPEPHEHERDRELLGGVGGAARRSAERNTGDADGDGDHAGVLVAPGVLAEHALADDQQHEQSRRERGLYDY